MVLTILYLLYSTEFIRDVALKTGIILDPVYTVKAAMGMLEELRKNPTRFRGRRILYLHTGEWLMTGSLALVLKTMDHDFCQNWVQLDFDILFKFKICIFIILYLLVICYVLIKFLSLLSPI